MSKYTTEVRFICENKSGLNNSVGFSDVDNVIDNSWNKIFTTNVEFFDEDYRAILCKKILKHYYLREIGTEVVGVWQLWMNTRLEEIMPYYNQLYKSTLIDFDPLNDINLTRKHTRNVDVSGQIDETKKDVGDSTQEEKGSSTKQEVGNGSNNQTDTITSKMGGSGTVNDTTTESKNKKDRYSDTPQGSISNLESDTYLTNARLINDNGTITDKKTYSDEQSQNGSQISNSSHSTTNKTDGTSTNAITSNTTNTSNRTNKNTENSTEDYLESLVGKQGNETYSEMISKYRDIMINVDMKVIEEFNDLFMGLW